MIPSDEELKSLWNSITTKTVAASSDDREKVARHILGMAERTIEGQLRSGLAANKRAGLLCGLFLMSAFTLVAFGLLGKETSMVYLSALGLCSISLVLASFFCYLAMRPIGWYFPGRNPGLMLNNEEVFLDDWSETLFYEGWNRQRCIDDNVKTTAVCTRYLKYGVCIGYIAIVGGILNISIRYLTLVGILPV